MRSVIEWPHSGSLSPSSTASPARVPFSASRSSRAWRTGKRPTRRAMRCASGVSSWRVGALAPAKPDRSIRALDLHPLKEQPMEGHVQSQRTAEALDQHDGTGAGRLAGKPGLLDRVRGDARG